MSRRVVDVSGIALLLLLSALLLIFTPVNAARGEATATASQTASWRVIDGDTFQDMTSGERFRLENIDTPETGPRAHCSAERELGDRATQEARVLIAGAHQIDVRRTGRLDRYDRVIAFFVVDGRDLGELMIAQGLARPW